MDPELRELKQSIDELTATNRTLINNARFWRSVTHGVGTAVGATIGAAVVIAVLGSILHFLAGVNLLKPFVDPVLPYVQRQQSTTQQSSLPQPTYQSLSPVVTPISSPVPATTPSTANY